MKFIFILFAGFLANSQAFAQTNSPLTPERFSYSAETCGYKRTMEMLPYDEYPWGICHSEYAHFNRRERELTRHALERWNAGYKNYLLSRWGTTDMVNIPKGKLFIESCNYEKYNIIYTKKEDFGLKKRWAYYIAIDTNWDLWTFHGEVVMNSLKNFSDFLFTNIMIHELGHALGLPHVRDHGEGNRHKNLSRLLIPAGFGCTFEYDICEFTDYDFEAFIAPFTDEPMARTDPRYIRAVEEREREVRFRATWACPDDKLGSKFDTAGCRMY